MVRPRRRRRSIEAARRLAAVEADRLANRRAKAPGSVDDPRVDREKVLLGSEGWLFLHNDGNDVIGQYTGRLRLTRRQRRRWSALIEARMRLVAELGATWSCWIVPEKAAVCSEFLPPGISSAERRPVDDILDLAASLRAPLAYPLDDLRVAKDSGGPPVFSATDVHWTQFGAFIVYEATCRALRDGGIEVPALSRESIGWRTFTAPGDLGSKLEPAPKGVNVRPEVPSQRSRLVFDNHVLNHGRTMVFERDDGVGPSAVVFGQSSANYLLIFLKESFRRLVFVHTATMPREVLQRERPDVVLTYPGERFMVRVPDDSSAMRQIAETIRIKRERGALRPGVGWFFDGIPGAGEVRNEFELPWAIPAANS
jgi:alginate O-acetyltransferase complex protein AlgJ